MSKKITVVDYGASNIGSVINMIKKIGGVANSSGNPQELLNASKLLLPGVGSFDSAMTKLKALGLDKILIERASAGVPLLGICLGMQLLASESEEGALPGLGLVPGRVKRFSLSTEYPLLKIPHMGWNRVFSRKKHMLADYLEEDARFYFVHSYHYICEDPMDELFISRYGYDFTSGVQRENVMGVQFHPEKSHRYGMQLIKNFTEI